MRRFAFLVAVVLSACSGSVQKSEQNPVTPTGTIYLRVLDVSTGGPLEGATVTVVGAAATGPTDSAGIFKLEAAVVSSSYTFVIEKTGYLRMTTATSLSATTGNSPLANPVESVKVEMYPTGGSIRGIVFQPNGSPAASATVVVNQRNTLGSSYESSPVTATTGADGSFVLTGLATAPTGVNHIVYAVYFDTNGDGNIDYATTPSSSVTVFPGTAARVFITYGTIGQRVVFTNIADGELGASENIELTFAMPVLATNLNQSQSNAYALTNTTRETTVPVTPTWAGTTQLSLKPMVGALREGDLYQLALRLTTTGQAGGTSTSTNFSATYAFQLRGSTLTPIADQISSLSVTNPNANSAIGQTPSTFDFNSNTFKIQWDGVAKAVVYFIYAKDTSLNPAYVQVAGPIPFVGAGTERYVTTITSMPASFLFAGQGGANPLAYNNRVTFAVVGQDVYGNLAPLSSAPSQTVSDNWAPSATGLTVSYPTVVDAINDGTAASSIVLKLTYNEPMDPATLPTRSFPSTVTTAFVWDSFTGASYSGTLTITIPAGADGTGTWSIRGGKDMAGNAVNGAELNGSFGGVKELVTNGSFESDGGCSLTGWTPSQTSTMPAPTAVSVNAHSGSCSAQLGASLNGTAAIGTSRIQQDITLPSLTGTGWSFRYGLGYNLVYALGPTGVNATPVLQTCRFEDTSETNLLTSLSRTNNNDFGYVSSPVAFGAIATARLVCEVNNSGTDPAFAALYVDDVSLQLVKPAAGGWFHFPP